MRISDKLKRGLFVTGRLLLETGAAAAVTVLLVSFIRDKYPILRESLRWLLGS